MFRLSSVMILICSVCLSSVTLASDKDVVILPKPGTPVANPNPALPPPSLNETSPASREDKNFIFTGQLAGFGPSRTLAIAGTAGYFLNRDMIVFFELGMGSKMFDVDDIFSDIHVRSRFGGLHFKHFVGNSFYYRLGVDYRTITYAEANTFLSNESHSFKSSSWGVTAAIGNQWQWKNFTMGCDWLGVTVPFSHDYSLEKVSNASERPDLESDKKNYTTETQINFLRFYMGASF